jgi:hypothetical protein
MGRNYSEIFHEISYFFIVPAGGKSLGNFFTSDHDNPQHQTRLQMTIGAIFCCAYRTCPR